MTKILQVIFVGMLGLVILFWFPHMEEINDFYPSTESLGGYGCNLEPDELCEKLEKEIRNENIIASIKTLYYLIPTFIFLFLTIKSFRQKNESLFYWTFLIGLTILQVFTIEVLIRYTLSDNESRFANFLFWMFFIIFLSGQIYSVYKLIVLRGKKSELLIASTKL